MASKRLLTFLAVAGCLILPAPAWADESGGVAFQSSDEMGGGIVAPAAEPEAPATADDPVAEPAQEETPTTPEGEEQPPAEQPDGEQEPTDENGGPVEQPDDDARGEAPAGTDGGSLPRTGLQLAALASVGVGLLLAGGALWPTSSWPRPRGRLAPSRRRR